MNKRGFLLMDSHKNVLWIPSDEMRVITDIFRLRSDVLWNVKQCKTLKEVDGYVHKYIKSEGADIGEEVEK